MGGVKGEWAYQQQSGFRATQCGYDYDHRERAKWVHGTDEQLHQSGLSDGAITTRVSGRA